MPNSQQKTRLKHTTDPNASDAAVYPELIDLLYRQSVSGYLITALNATILLVALYGAAPPLTLNLWYVLLITVLLVRYLLCRNYLSRAHDPQEAPVWANRFVLGTGLTGLLWGLAITLLLPTQSPVHQTIILVIAAGMAAGGVTFLAPLRQAYYAYILPMLPPLSIWMFIQPGLLHKLIGVLVLSFLVALVSMAHRLHSFIVESLILRNERRDLVDDLDRSREQLQNSNTRLSEMIAELIEKGKDLRKSNQFLARIMDNATNAIFVLDLQGRFTHANDVTCTMTGFSQGELIGKPLASLSAPETSQQVDEMIHAVAEDGELIKRLEIELERGDEIKRIINCTITPLQEGNDMEALVGTAEDITERKRVERLKDGFISTVSHELRTPLTSIRGALGLINDQDAPITNAQKTELIDIAYKNCERLIYLINDLLDVQKLEAGEMQFTSNELMLAEVVEEAVTANQSYAAQYQVDFKITHSERDVYVYVDKNRLIQVLANLLSNAAKFSPSGETVDIKVNRIPGQARISVIDHGPGIANEFRHRIFEKFAQMDSSDQRRRGGTGLGLNLSKYIVEQMNGTIGFASAVGRGTTFHVDLPLAKCDSTRSNLV